MFVSFLIISNIIASFGATMQPIEGEFLERDAVTNGGEYNHDLDYESDNEHEDELFPTTHAGDIPISIFWRPRVELASRVYAAKTNHDKVTVRTTYKMPWRIFIRRVLSPRFLFLPVPAAKPEDIDMLLGNALILMFKDIQRQI